MSEASVVIPTIGRPTMLARALESLAACDPQPAEVIVVDQSGEAATGDVVGRASGAVRHVRSRGRGRGLAVNEGVAAAATERVLITDDDCTVAPDWIGQALLAWRENPDAMLTGRVMPGGDDPRAVPSLREDPSPHDHTGELACGALYGGNMGCGRDALLAIGGFDERVTPTAEDNDLCYRWLRAGERLLYVPAMRVWHHDWRTPDELRVHYRRYGEGQGVFYAKHLRAGDARVLRFLAEDLLLGVRALAAAWVRGRPAWSDPRRGMARGMLPGLRSGWRRFGRDVERRERKG